MIQDWFRMDRLGGTYGYRLLYITMYSTPLIHIRQTLSLRTGIAQHGCECKLILATASLDGKHDFRLRLGNLW